MIKNIIILLAVISVSLTFGYFFSQQNSSKTEIKETKDNTKLQEKIWKKQNIKIGDKNYEIFVTETEEERNTGLAAFENIKDNEGMLFEFPEENFYSFWMKDMKFDIDIIFLDQNKKVIQIFESVQKSSYQNKENHQIYLPKLKSKYVIEIKSGESKKNQLKVGDVIVF